MIRSDTYISLSALQHWLVCPRQCALIHIARVCAHNRLTAEGRILHERADVGWPESRDGIRILRAGQIVSNSHGLHGVAEVVEMRAGAPYPVEYKRGRSEAHRADEMQLCAQDAALRDLTLVVAAEVRTAMACGLLRPPG